VEISEVAFAYRFFNAKLRLPVLRNKSCNLLVCKDQVRSSEINQGKKNYKFDHQSFHMFINLTTNN